ncbi:hypothetical protein [Blastococcus sp. SYSU DS0616]
MAQGLLTPDQLRSSAWRRRFRDVYVHRDVVVDHELRVLAAATLVRPDAVVTGCSAAVLWGVDLAGPDDDVELTASPSNRPVRVAGIRVRRATLAGEDVRWWLGARVTSPEATAVRVAAALPGDDAVIALDRLAAARVIDLAEVRRRQRSHAARERRRPDARARWPTGSPSHPRRPACDCSSSAAGCPCRSPSTKSVIEGAS